MSLTKIGALTAMLFFACCVARSDAQVAAAAHERIDPSKVVGTWYAVATSRDPQIAMVDAREKNIVASANGLMTTPKVDVSGGVDTHVSPLHVTTEIRMHRVYEDATPELHFTSHLAPGRHQMLRAGVHGAAWINERVTLWDGIVADRQIITREVVQAAKPALIVVGAPRTLAQLRMATPYRTIATAMTMVATAYTANTATAYPTGFTATGIPARQGIVAVDPHVIPLGSLVFVPGYGIAVAADTGGAIVGRRIDLCMDSYDDAVNFGRKTVQVYVLKR